MQNPTPGGAGVVVPWFSVLAAWVAGCALQLQQPSLSGRGIYIALVLLALAIYTVAAIKKIAFLLPHLIIVAAVVLFSAGLGFGLTGWRAASFVQDSLAPALEGRDVLLTGSVQAMPQRNESGLRFRFAVESATLDGAAIELPPVVYLGWYVNRTVDVDVDSAGGPLHQLADVRAGDRWQLTARLKAPHGNVNPSGFDYELWLWEQGLQATGYVRDGARDIPAKLLERSWRHPVERARQAVKAAIDGQVSDRRAAGIISALVLGDQNAIDRADWDVFRATGVAHLMSISGLHVTMFAWLAALVTGWLWRQSGRLCLALPAPTAGLAGGLLLAAAYAVFSGWGVPSQRTIWMLATVGLLRFLGKRWPWPLVWMLACAVVVAIDPWALLQAGFWLSFVAVGLLFATENGALNKGSTGADGSFYIKNWQKFVSILREQWIITLGLAPLTLILFGQASVVGLLANAVAIPWVTLVVTPLAMLGAALALVWPALLALAVSAIDALSWSLQHFAALPFAVVAIPQPPWWAAASAIAGGLLLVVPWPLGLRALGLPLLCPFLLWQPLGVPDGEFELLAADIGQGNAVILRTASHALLYDAGPRFSLESDAGSRVLVPLLRAIGVTLDTVVLSHRDTDHVGGAAAVLAMQPQAALISSLEAGHEIEQLRPVQRCLAGQHWVWDGVAFEVLHPAAGDYSQAGERLPRPNTLSCVLRVVSRSGRAALLTGDVEAAQEKRLAQAAALGLIRLESDVLLVPHHGSKTSSSPEFLDAVKPHIALVQAGYRNRFGHPVALVMDRYLERHIQVQISARCGAESWRSDQPELTTCQRVLGARYWHHQGF